MARFPRLNVCTADPREETKRTQTFAPELRIKSEARRTPGTYIPPDKSKEKATVQLLQVDPYVTYRQKTAVQRYYLPRLRTVAVVPNELRHSGGNT